MKLNKVLALALWLAALATLAMVARVASSPPL